MTGPAGIPGSRPPRRSGRRSSSSMARPWCSASTASPTSIPALPQARPRSPALRLRLPGARRDDLCRLPLHLRKTNLAQPLRGRAEGIFVAPFAQGEIGPELFEAACRMGLEGLVSKHRERVYRAADATTGSRSRTGNTRPLAASRTSSEIGKIASPRRRQHLRKKGSDLQSTCMLVSETSLFTRLGPPSCQASQKNASIAATS